MKQEKLTIIEIASLSGVSVSTVSRVINNHPSVSKKTRARVNEVIEKHGYTPSMFARGMINRTSNLIAVVVPDITNPYFISLISEIENSIHRFGYSLILMNTMTAGPKRRDNAVKVEIETFNTIESKQVDGVIILGGEIDQAHPDPSYIKRLNRMSGNIPVVIIGQKVEGVQCSFIERDLNKGVNLLVLHLLSLGYRNIAFVGGEQGVTIFEERKNTYIETLKLYHPDFEPIVITNDFYAKDGYDSLKTIHNDHPDIEAIIAINDVVATGAIRACLDLGIDCPKDMAIVSCDMFLDNLYHIPRLTTVNQHNDYLGHIAVHHIVSAIDGDPMQTLTQHSPELVIGETCGAKQL